MPNIALLLAAAGIALADTSLPTITLFPDQSCKGTAYGSCRNIRDNTCCKDVFNSFGFGAATIKPIYYYDIGAVYSVLGNKKCGKVKNSSNGPIICLGAPGGLDGAAWFNCQSCPISNPGQKRDESSPALVVPEEYTIGQPGNCSSSVPPDKLTFIDGHTFEVGPTTPSEVTAMLYRYAFRDHTVEDLPEEFMQYEVEHEEVSTRAAEIQAGTVGL